MSVIVKGMDMPTECRECHFNKFGTMSGETYCGVNGVTIAKNFETISFDGRPEWCPLVELPDHHGRLVDADATIKEIKARNPYDVSYEDAWAITCIEHAPTIVESEDGT